MKSNEIYDRLRNKIDPEAVKILVAIAEDQATVKKRIIGVAAAINQLTDIVMLHSKILGSIKEPLDNLKRMLNRGEKSTEMVMSEPVMGVDEEIEKS